MNFKSCISLKCLKLCERKTSTVNVRNPNVRFGKRNKKLFGFQHVPISEVRAVRFVWFKKLDHFIYIYSGMSKTEGLKSE